MFESGVSHFITGEATVHVHFPVNEKGKAFVACKYCQYLSGNDRICRLNGEVVQFPMTNVGAFCPLEIENPFDVMIREEKHDDNS